MTRITDIKARLEAASPGPWSAHEYGFEGDEEPRGYIIQQGEEFQHSGIRVGDYVAVTPFWSYADAQNATLMSNAPTDLAALVELLEMIDAKMLERAQSLRATANRMSREILENRPGSDAVSAANFHNYASEAEASYGTIRAILSDQGHLL